MYKQGIPGFPYYVGIDSLAEVATRDDRICVLNLLGNESRSVTPISHAFSGGNVVFGTAPGKRGEVLETPAGDIPVFDNVRDGLDAGLSFTTGVIYLPPAAVRHGVYELVRVNREIRKIVIITEKVPVHDARAIRAVAQQLGIDVFGANCLGVADSWNRVRIGGALGGDRPDEALRQGSVAVYSNSGNFTTTLATYLAMAGWGTTTLISSGKDQYIHYAAPEWAHAFANDERSQAAVMYVEPGGYYERGLRFAKPVVACVVGRWKEKLTRPVGHAGAIAGTGDSAVDKEGWFKEALQVDGLYTPERPVFGPRGALVDNIAHVPAALTAVLRLHGIEPDFAAHGSLALKPWFGNDQGLEMPAALRIAVVEAIEPYREQIRAVNRRVGAVFGREGMKDASGASRMDPETQVTSLHGIPVLDAGRSPFESNLCMALLRQPNDEAANQLASVIVTAFANLHGDPMLAAAGASREAGSSPSMVLGSALGLLGPRRVERARRAVDVFIDAFAETSLEDPWQRGSGLAEAELTAERFDPLGPAPSSGARGRAIEAALATRGIRSVFLDGLAALGRAHDEDLLLAAASATLAWRPLRRRRVSRLTARNLPWFLRLYAATLGASVPPEAHGPERFLGRPMVDLLERRSLTDVAVLALTGEDPTEASRVALQMVLGLLVSNGPGTISAQGAKGAVSADGPETPDRVQLNKAMVGFLTHSGYSHGGNGYEGIRFLVDRFEGLDLADPGAPDHGLDLAALARAYARQFAEDKAAAKAVGDNVRAIPGVNHPVYRGKPVNIEPREAFIFDFFRGRGERNVFHDFYRELVQALFDEGVTRNVFAVNIDAVISALLLKMLWGRYRGGELRAQQLEEAAFHLFLYGRMIGCAAEIDDHLNRGRNMDTRTPAASCRHIA
ncbi:MAG: CoA-binding protein [Sandaracinaceae bacterium]